MRCQCTDGDERPLQEPDWTVDPETGRSNSSEEFNHLAGEVERLIRSEAFSLIAGRADRTAALIIAQLAHKHGMEPKVYVKAE